MKTVVILGFQGSGKGTQAKLLVERFGFQHIEVGALLRAKSAEQSEEGKRIAGILKEGKLVPFELVMRIVREAIAAVPSHMPLVIDGTPRRLEEVTYWEKTLPELGRAFTDILFIELDDEKAIERMGKRRMCSVCSTPYIRGVDLAEGEQQCPKCGGRIIQRNDETPEAVKNRLTWSHEQTGPVIAQYEQQGILRRINGDQTIDAVHTDIVRALGFA